ncbi:hypothetical protein TSOC_001718 [Tetrabaena socialis]|uniref:Protein kinase domain-containing protein n=1 Tax=Tetrabaena socialis TaxID=47790 RepID=A0A2J8AG14_9CHLO|nr:hypothetical protein TSOC_001718 [Tetrabaena socialis]|eukprot:PNH11465.1 hypothetical protein TSOC_001718 [Tetrabaena socialis]
MIPQDAPTQAMHGGLELAVMRLAGNGSLQLLLQPLQQPDRSSPSRQRREHGRHLPQELLQEGVGGEGVSSSSSEVASADCGLQQQGPSRGWCRAPEQLLGLEGSGAAADHMAHSSCWAPLTSPTRPTSPTSPPYPSTLTLLPLSVLPPDIFAVGCILAELATGSPLFPGATPREQLRRMVRLMGPLPPAAAEGRPAARAAGLGAGGTGAEEPDRCPSNLNQSLPAAFHCSRGSGGGSGAGGSGASRPRLLRQWLLQRVAPGGTSTALAGAAGAPLKTASVTAGEPAAAASAAPGGARGPAGAAELADVVEACLSLAPQHRPDAAELLRMPYFAVPAGGPTACRCDSAAAAATAAAAGPCGSIAAAAIPIPEQAAVVPPSVARAGRPTLEAAVARSLGAARKWTSERASGSVYGSPQLLALAERPLYALRLHSRTSEGDEEGAAPPGLAQSPRPSGMDTGAPAPTPALAPSPAAAAAPAHPSHPTSARAAWGPLESSTTAWASGAQPQPGGLRGAADVSPISHASPTLRPQPYGQQRPGTPGTLAALTAQLRSWPLYGAQPVEGGGAGGGMAKAASVMELAGVKELVLLETPHATAGIACGQAPPTTLVLPGPSEAPGPPSSSPSPSTAPSFPSGPPAYLATQQPLTTAPHFLRGADGAVAVSADGLGGGHVLQGPAQSELHPQSRQQGGAQRHHHHTHQSRRWPHHHQQQQPPLPQETPPSARASDVGSRTAIGARVSLSEPQPEGPRPPQAAAAAPHAAGSLAAAVAMPRRSYAASVSRSDSLESLLELEGAAAAARLSLAPLQLGGASSPGGSSCTLEAFEDDSASAPTRRTQRQRQRSSTSRSPPGRPQPLAAPVEPVASARRSLPLAPEFAAVSLRRRSQPLAMELAAVSADASSRRRSQPLLCELATVSTGDPGWQQLDGSVGSGGGALPRLINVLQRELQQQQVTNTTTAANSLASSPSVRLHLPAQPQPPSPPPPPPPLLPQPPGGNGFQQPRRMAAGPGRDLLNMLSEESADLAAHLPLIISLVNTETLGLTGVAASGPLQGNEPRVEGTEPARSGGGGGRGGGAHRAEHGGVGGEPDGGAGQATSAPKGFARRARDRIRSYFSEDGGGGGGSGGAGSGGAGGGGRPRTTAGYERNNSGSGGGSTGGGGSTSGQSSGAGATRSGRAGARGAASQVDSSEGGDGGSRGGVGGRGALVRTLTRAFKFGAAVRQKIAPLKEQPR